MLVFTQVRRTALFLALASTPALGQQIELETDFLTLDELNGGARTSMDVGGAWNGTNDQSATDGDRFRLTIDNSSGSATAFDLGATLTLPAGFTHVAGAIVGPSGTTVSGTTGTLTINLPSNTDLVPGGTLILELGVIAAATTSAGTYSADYAVTFGTADGLSDGSEGPEGQAFLVESGASLLLATPATQSAAVGDTATFTLSVTNTGSGGLFDVTLDESAILAAAGRGLSLVNLVQAAPLSPAATGSAPILTIPYLAADATFNVTATALVEECTDLVNEVESIDRVAFALSAAPEATTAQVELDLQVPLVAVNTTDVSLFYGDPRTVSIEVANTGDGSAVGIALQTNIESLGVTVDASSLSTGWSYAGAGRFVLSTPTSLGNLESNTLEFDVQPTDVCAEPGGGLVVVTAEYTNDCGDAYAVPTELFNLAAPADSPSVSVAVATGEPRLEVGEAGSYTIVAGAANATNLAGGSLQVLHTIPANLTSSSASVTAGSLDCANCVPGTSLIWSLTPAEATAGATLTVNYTAPTDECEGGNLVSFGASVATTSTAGCPVSDTASEDVLLINSPDAGTTLNFEVTTPPEGRYETGTSTSDGVRDGGEGEFIELEATYTFGAGQGGMWSASTFVDDFTGVAGQALVPGTLEANIDGGGYAAVPGSAIQQSTGALSVDLAFVGIVLGNDNLGGVQRSLDLRYRTTAPDAALGADANGTLLQRSTLTLTGTSGSGSCNGEYVQGVYIPIGRAGLDLTLDVPSVLDICDVVLVGLDLDLANAHGADNVVVTLGDSGDYEYEAGQTPVFGGAFSGANVTVVETAGSSIVFTFTGGELNGDASIDFNSIRRGQSGTTPTPLSASVTFDSEESANTVLAGYVDGGQDSPALIRLGEMQLQVLSETLTVFEDQIRFKFAITNTGNGGLYEVDIVDLLPAGILVDAAATDLANPGTLVTVGSDPREANWTLTTVAPGATTTLELVATVTSGAACAATGTLNSVSAAWGCGSVQQEAAADNSPEFLFPNSSLSVTHDTTNSVAKLCETGLVEIVLINTGGTTLFDVSVDEVLEPSANGVDLVPGSVELSLDGAAFVATSDPTGTGTGASPYRWTTTEIGSLAELDPKVGGDGDPSTVRIRFDIASTEDLAGSPPSLSVSAAGTLACGDPVSSSSPGVQIALEEPSLSIAVTGRNVSDSGTFAEQTMAKAGDTVRWKVRVTNSGPIAAQEVRLALTFPPSGITTGTISPADESSNASVATASVYPLPGLAAGAFYEYEIEQTIGTTCTTEDFTAEVTFGCIDNGSNTASNLPASTVADAAELQMNPDFSSNFFRQTVTRLADGRAELSITMDNDGAGASAIGLTVALPSTVKLDPSFTPVLDSGSPLTLTTTAPYDADTPVFAFSGTLDNNEVAVLRLRVLPASGFDSASDPLTAEESPANGFDPATPATLQSTNTLTWDNTCGDSDSRARSQNVTIDTPDLDLETGLSPQVVTPGSDVELPFSLIARGESGSDLSHPELSFAVGSGWSNVSFSIDGGAATAATSFGLAELGAMTSGDTVAVVFSGTATTGGPLTLLATSGASVYNNAGVKQAADVLAVDTIRPRVLSFELTKTLDTSSGDGTSLAATSGTDIAIGETITWRVQASWAGGGSGEQIEGAILRETLPSGFEYVTHAVEPGSIATSSVTTPSGSPLLLDFGLVDFTESGSFEFTVTGRLVDGIDTPDQSSFRANFGTTFEFQSGTFASSDSDDGFSGTLSGLHAEADFAATVADLEVAKQVALVTSGTAGTFADNAAASAMATVEYSVVIENKGTGPAFDVHLADALQDAELELIALSGAGSDGIDNDGDGIIDEALEGTFTAGPSGTLDFDDASTGLAAGTPSATLAQLDGGESLTLRYRVLVGDTAVPSAVYDNEATLTASSLPGTPDEAEDFAPDAVAATVTIPDVTLAKSLVSTSEPTTSGADLAIGEQARFRLDLVLPAGQTPALEITDSLPENLSLLNVTSVTLGSGITGSLQSTSPAVLPAAGNPLGITWGFSTLDVVASADASTRLVRIEYDAQVINDTQNTDGSIFSNTANFSYAGGTGSDQAVDLDVVEPLLAVDQTLTPDANFDAGDEIAFEVTVSNTGNSYAFDLDLIETLPAGLAYKPGSTELSGSGIADPDIASNVLTWGRSQATPQDFDLIEDGADLVLTFIAIVQDSVLAGESLEPDFKVDGTSLNGDPGPNLGTAMGAAGAPNGERTGTNLAVNQQSAFDEDASATVAEVVSLALAAEGETLGANEFRVGDLVTYRLTASLTEATFPNFEFDHVLPAGLEFAAVTSATSGSGLSTSANDYPTAGATGALNFDFGTLVNAGDGGAEDFVLIFTARLVDDLTDFPLYDPLTLTASANVDYDSDAGAQTVNATDVDIGVLQPELTYARALATGQTTTVAAGDAVDITSTVENVGDAPAYAVALEDLLPAGLRDATPTTVSATLGGVAITLNPAGYLAGTGVLTYLLPDNQPLLPGEQLVLTFRAEADADVGGPLDLTISGQLDDYRSKPAADGAENRSYPESVSLDATVSTPGPTDITKLADVSTLNIGDTVTWTITAPETAVDVALHDLTVSDAVPSIFRVISVSTNAAVLGATESGTAGPFVNALSVGLDLVPAGERAVVTVTAVLENQAATDTATSFDNSASFRWATANGGPLEPALTSPDASGSVTEPDVTVDLQPGAVTVADTDQGPQAGDTITYHVVLTNSGDGTAHDIVLDANVGDAFISPVVGAGPDNPGTPTNTGSSGGVDVWTWNLVDPLDPGDTYEFDVTYTIGGSAMPFEVLSAFADTTWTSTAGASADERDGSGGIDDYADDDADSPVQLSIGPVSLAKTEPGDGTYAIGEAVTWTLTMSAGQGEVSDLVFEDALPTGLEYRSFTVSSSSFQALGGGAVAVGSAPTAGDTGALRFVVGDIESTGANPSVTLNLTARVLDVPANVDTAELSNTALVEIESPPGSGTFYDVPASSASAVDVAEPALTLALDPPAEAVLGTAFQPVARLTNVGTTDAWQPEVQVQVAEGARDTDPTTLTANLVVSGGRSATLILGVDYTLSWDAGTGVLSAALIGGQGYAAPGETLTLTFSAALDDDASDTEELNFSATATTYASLDGSAGAPDFQREYPTALGVGTTDTDPGDAGDDATDGTAITISAPVVTVAKAVDATEFAPDAFVQYTLTLSNAGTADADDVELTDEFSDLFEPGTLEFVSQAPDSGSLSLDPTGGANGTGSLQLSGATVTAGGTLELVVRARLAAVLPSGSVISNQASADLPNFTAPVLSDSTAASDDNALESGNDAGDPADDDATTATVVSAPVIAVTKSAADDNGAPLAIQDTLTYSITVSNTGDEDAVALVLQDPTPSFTSYVPGSTTLNGASVADIDGASALGAGLPVQAPGALDGELPVGDTITVTFRVSIDEGGEDGTLISNQAVLLGQGEGSGAFSPVPSDNPSTAAAGDATVVPVGTSPVLNVIKTVADLDGGELLAGDALLYRIAIENVGAAAADGLFFVDPLPAGTVYNGGLLFFDADGPGPGTPQNLTDVADGDPGDVNVTTAGAVTIQLTQLAAGTAFEVGFVVEVDPGATVGQKIFNQATVDAIGLTAVLSDADGNDANGDQPTIAVVGSAPALILAKSVADLNGGLTQASDRLRYTLELRNVGTDGATGVVVSDTTPPANTTYVPGSTALDGVVQADSAGVSALNAGISLGELAPGAGRTITFEVEVAPDAAFATLISNQATYSANGALSGVSDSDVDDGQENGNDPDNPNDDDPTLLQVGAAPGAAGVSGVVWLDLDHDGEYDQGPALLGGSGGGGEPPQADWTVEVLRDGVFLTSAVTGADGAYAFSGLPPGAGYSIRFLYPDSSTVYGGAVSEEPGVDLSAGQIDNLTLNSGDNVLDQNLPIDPSGVVYDSVARVPVPGATLTVSGPPGFDPATMLPPGQQSQVTGADGFYRFDLIGGAPAGVYSIQFDVPPGYLPSFPSLLIFPEPAPLDPTGLADPFLVQPQPTAPQQGDDTTYYTSFDLEPGDPNVVNNHVAIDPILEGAIAITKTTPRKTVERGGLVPYTLRVTNTLNATLTPTDVVDFMPPGFKYVEGSARIDGAPVTPAVANRELRFDGLAIPALATIEIDLVLVVGAGVGSGKFINQAFARNPIADATISNIATASILVVPDPLFDHTDILGKVFDDRNGNGVQDRGEPGVPGVRLATTRGLIVTTDEYGRYHIVCPEVPNRALGTNFVVKIDTRSLPTGFRSTTENPRVIRLTRGKFATADFGVTVGKLLRVDLSRDAFEADSWELTATAESRLVEGLARLVDHHATVRVGYQLVQGEAHKAGKSRMNSVLNDLEDLWERVGGRGPLDVERDALRYLRAPRTPSNSSSGFIGELLDGPPDSEGHPTSGGRVAQDTGLHFEDTPYSAERDGLGGLVANPPLDGIAILIDGQTLDGDLPLNSDRDSDVILHGADLQVRADGLILEPALSTSTWPQAYQPFRALRFETYSNYAAFVTGAELRVFRAGDSTRAEPLAVLPVELGSGAVWTPDDYGADLHYVLRVYDADGHYDETGRQLLRRLHAGSVWPAAAQIEEQRLRAWGQDQLARQTIPLEGTAITVSGRRVPAGLRAVVEGLEVPLSPRGDFAVRTLLPGGRHSVDVELLDAAGLGLTVTRSVVTPEADWFFVGLADLTIGQNSVSGPADLFTGEDSFLAAGEDEPFDDEFFVNGRVAFYLKGKVLGSALLTASLDTGDEPLEDILSRLDEKDPRAFLRRLDPTVYYPVYGDDSTVVEDAPTRGKFYVRLERGDDRVLWGDFTVRMTETELAQVDRALYGANVRWTSAAETSFGESRTSIEGFAAEPGTLAGRDELRGTGGSLYYTSRQDLTIGSERVRLETRDKVSGLVLSTEDLVPNEDYTIDYLQGRVFLNSPLASVGADGDAVETGQNSGDPQYLVVRYEYTPGFDQLDDLALGGRVSQWLSDGIEVGGTYSTQEQQGQDGELYGVDVTLRKSESTYLRAEFAGTEGPGQGATASLDGGFSFGAGGGIAPVGQSANAVHVETAINLNEVSNGRVGGDLSAYFTDREQGFDAPGQFAAGDTTLFGARYRAKLTEDTSFDVEIDSREEDQRSEQLAAELDLQHRVDEHWRAELGLRFDDLEQGSLAVIGTASGARTDAALRVAYDSLRDWDAELFLQGTLERDGGRQANNRYGVGFGYRPTDRLRLSGAVSGGNGGLGGRLGLEYRLADQSEAYLTYLADVDRSDTGIANDNGAFVAGARHRFSDTWSIYGEERVTTGGSTALVHAYGLDFTPDDRWSFGVAAETGTVQSNGQPALERTALSVNGGYSTEDVKFASAIEYRDDENAAGSRQTWLLRSQYSTQVDPDWRAITRVQTALSDDSSGAFFDGDFTEAVFGMAYRPVETNRLNALFKYTYLEDVPTAGQNTVAGASLFAQRSHVLSADATYDLTPRFSLGGKLAGRMGELRTEGTEWFDSLAWLALIRLDLHIVEEWDWLVEGRRLEVTEAEDVMIGALTAVYRHIGEHLKIGIGYDFADFSDDLTDLDHDSSGWFVNMVGAF